MNIKLKAALEVTGFIIAITIVVAGVQSILSLAAATYGTEAVINGIAFGFVCVASYVCVGLLYDIRVAKLQYRAKLNEMVKK